MSSALFIRFSSILISIPLLLAAAPSTSRAQTVTDVELLVFNNKSDGVPLGWTFECVVEGSSLNVVTLTPPGEAMIGVVDGDSTFREFESTPFASFAALQQNFPAGTYEIDVNGTVTLMIAFDPMNPNGGGVFTFPTNGSSTTDTTPTFTLDNSACTNCDVQVVSLEDTAFFNVDTEFFEFAPFSSSVLFASFGPNQGAAGPIAELPLDDYEVCLSLARGTIESDVMNGGETFNLIRAAVDENCIEFSVVPAPQVDEVELEIIERRIAGVSQGWFFVAFVIGQDLLNGTITPPGGAPLDLSISFPGEIGFISGSFLSSAALQAAFPPSDAVNKYDVSLNGGVATISLDFDPLIPDGGTTVTSPADMATVGSQPSFTVANTCTNCTTRFAEIFDIGTNGDLVLLELEEGLPFSATIGLSDFGANEGSLGPITELPEDDYFFLTEVLNEDVTVESFTPTDDFDYFAGAFRDDRIEFTVPEPEGSVLVAAALLTLARLARRRQRS